MTDGPTVQRDGDTWALSWADKGVAMGLDRLREKSDGLTAEVTIESTLGGRVLGPVGLNLLSTRSQAELANRCHKRVNTHSAEVWDAMVVYACAVVAKQFRAPTPTHDLSQVADTGPLEYAVPGLVPRDETTVMYGDGESAKSLLALCISFCVRSGRELPWGTRPEMAEVLYLDWETNLRTVAQRLRRIALGEFAAVPKIHYRQCFRSLSDELPNLREEVSRKHVGLVVVDSIGFAASGALTEDETARTAMNALRQLSPATRLVVAHVSKQSADSPGPVKPFGSNFFWNGMRSGIEIRRAEDTPNPDAIDLALFHRKANDGEHHVPIGLRVLFDGHDKGILFTQERIEETPDLLARTSLSSRLRALLGRGSKSTAELAEELDVKESTVRTTVGRMNGVVRLTPGSGRGSQSVWGLSE